MCELMLQYAVVGGMPDAVQTFIDTKQMDRVLQIQRDIVRSYEDDIDFVIRWCGACVLVESKASTGNVKSAKTILAHPEKYHVDLAIKLGDYNVGIEGKILTLPMYMGFLLTEK